jgi:hypothetical protein
MTPCHEQRQKRQQLAPNPPMHPKSASWLAALLLCQATLPSCRCGSTCPWEITPIDNHACMMPGVPLTSHMH